ncbi:MAG: hypothetical protein JOY71_03645 [Acetobacteraceae bacterium]|nr:hypothetical protein [Acetobacteraceae bacterium]MBV8521216.1 hypothetical protein [Acetobacteraceae bacterium]MBV8590335.1 hypothetical protein [Acetobacteraceae bacterium]
MPDYYYGKVETNADGSQRWRAFAPSGYELRPRTDIYSHPTGDFAWGYKGSGLCNLAAAILADYMAPAVPTREMLNALVEREISFLRQNQGWMIRRGKLDKIIKQASEQRSGIVLRNCGSSS